MVVVEFAAVIVESPLRQEAARTGLVQPRVVQHDQAGMRGEIRPHIVVARRVTELIDDEIVGIALRAPREIEGPGLRETVDVMSGARACGTMSAL